MADNPYFGSVWETQVRRAGQKLELLRKVRTFLSYEEGRAWALDVLIGEWSNRKMGGRSGGALPPQHWANQPHWAAT